MKYLTSRLQSRPQRTGEYCSVGRWGKTSKNAAAGRLLSTRAEIMSGPIQRRSITLLTRPHSAGELPAVLRRPRRVLAHAALEKLDAVRLEGERVRADAVEEPTVVRDDERAATAKSCSASFVCECTRWCAGCQVINISNFTAFSSI